MHIPPGHVHELGKRSQQSVNSAVTGCRPASPLLFVCDVNGRRYLVDSGSEVSILPPVHPAQRLPESSAPLLRAANGTKIDVFAKHHRTEVDLGLGRVYMSYFFVADVPTPILGADFLREHGLIPDLKAACLRDGATYLSTPSCPPPNPPPSLAMHVCVEGGPAPTAPDGPDFAHLRQSPLFASLVAPPGEFPTVTAPGVMHSIQTRGRPVYARARRLMPEKLGAAKRELDDLLDQGILVPSQSPWSSPIHLVPKGSGTSYRLVGCYEHLNAITVPDRYPVPNIQTFSDQLNGSQLFSKIDLARAFAQIPMDPADQCKTAIITPFGLFEYTRMPFGLCNAAQSFQRLMDTVLRGLPRVFVYIDDILVFSHDPVEHLADLDAVFSRLKQFGLVIRPEKCVLGQSEVDFLGFRVSSAGLAPLPDKVADLLDFPSPTSIKECRSFIGMVNYYHRFVPRLASVLRPLHDLASGPKAEFQWTQEQENAFRAAKSHLAKCSTLAFPQPDAPIQVVADASDNAVGAVVQQLQGGRWVPLAFHSKKITGAQLNWSTGDKELYALVSAVRKFRYLLEGRPGLQLCTDHKPLVHAFTSRSEKSARVQRHLAFLSEFSTDIRHISGVDNVVSDYLSRPPPAAVQAVTQTPVVVEMVELAAQQHQSPDVRALAGLPSLRVESRAIPGSPVPLLVDVSSGAPRPLVPASLTRRIFDQFHGLRHPGIRATRRLLSERFVWKNMSTDIRNWCRGCLRCQSSKVIRHQHTALVRPAAPSSRFEYLHVDIVGPLEYSRGYRYIFTIVDRYTRYPEAIPIPDATAAECARALMQWISRHGMCSKVTSDRGRQFISELWGELHVLLGIQRTTTLAYQPQQNGLVERFHRDMKAALMSVLQGDPQWCDALPVVMLGLRASFKPDLGMSSAELVFGEALHLPGQFFDPTPEVPHTEFAQHLRTTLSRLRPVPTSWHQGDRGRAVFVSDELQSSTHVFVRVDSHRAPLQPPYKGPYRVLRRGAKSFEIDLGGTTDTISVDRLKPAFMSPSDCLTGQSAPLSPEFPSDRHASPLDAGGSLNHTPSAPDVVTRAGRVSRPPARLNL